MNQPLLAVNNLTHLYAPDKGFRDVSFELWPGEVLGICLLYTSDAAGD